MLSAIWLSCPERGALATPERCSIHAFDVDDSTRALARSSKFTCEICGTAMTAAFPHLNKPGRRKSPSPYFRAIQAHREGFDCERRASAPAAAEARSDSPSPGRASRHRAPGRFVDAPPPTPVNGNIVSVDAELDRVASAQLERRPGAAASFSIASVRNVRHLAIPWHLHPALVRANPLSIPGCPGKDYESAFRRIDAAAGECLPRDQLRYVYWGRPSKVIARPSGFDVRFPVRAANNRWLRAWISRRLEGSTLPQILAERLEAAVRDEPMTVYLLGTFRAQEGRFALTLEPKSFRHMWLEPGDPGVVARAASSPNRGARDK